MKIEQLKQAMEIYRTKSINKAAHNLFIAQSTLSSSMQALEKEFGREIFVRTQKGVETTAFGTEFIHLCAKMLDTYHEMQALAEESKMKMNRQKFHISVHYLDFAIRLFYEFYNSHKHLNADFQYHECSRSCVIDHIADGISELGVLTLPSLRKTHWLELIHANGSEYFTLSVEEPKILVGTKNPIAQKEDDGIYMKELAENSMILYEEEGELFQSINRSIIEKYQIKNYIRLNGRGSLKEMLKETDGYHLGTFNERAYAKYHYDDCIKVYRLLDEDRHHYEIGYIKKIGVPLSELGESYVCMLRELLQEDPKQV